MGVAIGGTSGGILGAQHVQIAAPGALYHFGRTAKPLIRLALCNCCTVLNMRMVPRAGTENPHVCWVFAQHWGKIGGIVLRWHRPFVPRYRYFLMQPNWRLGRHSQSPATRYRFRYFFAAMYSSSSLRTHFGPPSSNQASRWACVSGRHDTGAGRTGAGGRPAPSRLPPLMICQTA